MSPLSPPLQSSSIIPLTLISLVPKRLSRILRKLMPMLKRARSSRAAVWMPDGRRRRAREKQAVFLLVAAGAGQPLFFLCRGRKRRRSGSEDADGLSSRAKRKACLFPHFFSSRASVLARGQERSGGPRIVAPHRRLRCRAPPM